MRDIGRDSKNGIEISKISDIPIPDEERTVSIP
jgi:hypothetical protein